MGIFSSIVNAIFGSGSAPAGTQSAAPGGSGASGSSSAPASASAAAPAPISRAEVEAQIAAIEAKRGVKYNWKQSIVDLMKLLDLDSSLAARKELATELGCPPELMNDSAKMNMWLHKKVLARIAENGGNVPKELLD